PEAGSLEALAERPSVSAARPRASTGACRCKGKWTRRSAPSAPPGTRRGRISGSREVLMHQRQDQAPVREQAAVRRASMRVRRREDDLLDRVGVVDARGQWQQVHHLVDRDVGLYLASDRLRERGDIGGRQLLRLLTDG